jgi:hypothetical protein
MLEDLEISISRWDGMHKFYEPGIEKSYEMDEFKEDRFLSFADRLVEHFPESFQYVEAQLDEPRICVATPKPEPMGFQEECIICEDDLQNNKIHFEVEENGGLMFICRYCFITLPKMEESLQEHIVKGK